MFSSKPRGSRIVYVAASARELPEEVQRWLGRAEHRAARSPHIYDALALLASGNKPAVMIVSMEAVDWSELGFFDQAARISRSTRIFVAGHHDAAKLEAACKQGARLFDEETAGEVLSSPAAWSRSAGMTDILAASLPASPRPPAMTPVFKPVPPEPLEIEEAEEDPEPEPLPAEEDEDLELESRWLPPGPTKPEESLKEPDSNKPDVHAKESGAGSSSEGLGDGDQPIPFPWAPNPNRPQRIPPKRACEQEGTGPGGADVSPAFEGQVLNEADEAPAPLQTQQAGKMPAPPSTRPAELTAEELSALMGRPIPPGKPAREGRA